MDLGFIPQNCSSLFSSHGIVCHSLSTLQKVNNFLGLYTVHVPINQITFWFGKITGVQSLDRGKHPDKEKHRLG